MVLLGNNNVWSGILLYNSPKMAKLDTKNVNKTNFIFAIEKLKKNFSLNTKHFVSGKKSP